MPSRLKQVIVIRADLKMRRGKEIAQGAHASGECLWELLGCPFPPEPLGWSVHAILHTLREWLDVIGGKKTTNQRINDLIEWRNGGMTKICVRVNSEEELLKVRDDAEGNGIVCHLITDSGRTEFDGVPTKTCLSLGPDTYEKLDAVTGDLKLY